MPKNRIHHGELATHDCLPELLCYIHWCEDIKSIKYMSFPKVHLLDYRATFQRNLKNCYRKPIN